MKTAADFDPQLLILFDAYVHGALDRRGFLEKARKYAVGGMTAAMVLDALNPKFAEAQQVPKDDARLTTSSVEYPSPQGYQTMRGYLARPAKATGKLPSVLVVHENRGLNPHIEDITRRMALEGFVALAPDFLSPQGGTPQDEDQAREMIRQLDQQQTIQNALAAVDFLEGQEATTDRVGVIGFCWGGALANEVAVNSANIDAVVPFYGRQPASSEVSKIQAPLLLHYAGLDDRINAGIPDYEQALKDAGVDYTIHIYEGVNHAFHNDTSQERYNQEAAELAWSRTIDFLKQHLADQA